MRFFSGWGERSMFPLKNTVIRKSGCFLIQSVPVRPSTQALFNINVLTKSHQPSTLTSGLWIGFYRASTFLLAGYGPVVH